MHWYLQALKKYVDFQGRARRKEYWYFTLFNALVAIVLFGIGTQLSFVTVLYYAYSLLVFIPGLAVCVRRLHDMGKSGYWLFIVLLPILGWLALLYFQVQPSQPNENAYGAVPA
jgi:uncharacterized membrane protein YhaH (DUF805 family)